MASAWIFGTRHDAHGLGPRRTAAGTECFLERIAQTVVDVKATLIAEEACSDSVKLFCGGDESPLGRWCGAQGLGYFAFDVNDEECAALDIPSSLDALAASANGQDKLADEISRLRFEGREAEWVRRLAKLEPAVAVIVVGARHVESMSEKLSAIGWNVQTAESCWLPPGLVEQAKE